MAPPGKRRRRLGFQRTRQPTDRQSHPSDDYRARNPGSSLLLVLDVPAEDFRDVGVFLFGFLDEGGVVEALVNLDLLLDVGNLLAADPFLLSLRLGVSLLERNELRLLSLGQLHFLRNRARRRLWAAPARRRRRHFVDHAAFRADDRIVVEIVELGAARGAEAFRAELGFRHGRNSLRQVEKRTSPWRLARPVSIAPAHAGRALGQPPDREKPGRGNRRGTRAMWVGLRLIASPFFISRPGRAPRTENARASQATSRVNSIRSPSPATRLHPRPRGPQDFCGRAEKTPLRGRA